MVDDMDIFLLITIPVRVTRIMRIWLLSRLTSSIRFTTVKSSFGVSMIPASFEICDIILVMEQKIFSSWSSLLKNSSFTDISLSKE